MIVRFNNYTGGYRVLSFAKDRDAQAIIQQKGMECLLLDDGMIRMLPDGLAVDISEEELQKLYGSCDFDVFEVYENGSAYKCFDCASNDNVIFITSKCNSNCIMCPSPEAFRKNGVYNSADNLIKIISYFPRTAEHITITGGEPFLVKKDIFRVLNYIKNNFENTRFLLLTNGRAFASNEYCRLFDETAPRNTIIGIPLHGHISELHDYITQTEDSFYQTCRGIRNLLALNRSVQLRIVVSKLNAEYLGQIAQLIIREFAGVDNVKIMAMEMTGSAAKNKEKVWIDYSLAFEKARIAIDELVKSGIDVALYNFPLCFVARGYWNICEKSISENKIRFAPQCNICDVKDACGGAFSGTIRLLKDQMCPIGIKND